MGCCMSASITVTTGGEVTDHDKPSANANVVSLTGELRQFPTTITASQVLVRENTSTSSAFLCHSDRLFFDDYIPALHPDDQLEPGQIYFLLPASKLHYRLTASDMAALAVKASLALQTHNNNIRTSKKKNRTRISPMVFKQEGERQYDNLLKTTEVDLSLSSTSYAYNDIYSNRKKQPQQRPLLESGSSNGLGISRSGSVRKLRRYSSRKAKMAVRSFKMRLTTVYEGSVLHFT